MTQTIRTPQDSRRMQANAQIPLWSTIRYSDRAGGPAILWPRAFLTVFLLSMTFGAVPLPIGNNVVNPITVSLVALVLVSDIARFRTFLLVTAVLAVHSWLVPYLGGYPPLLFQLARSLVPFIVVVSLLLTSGSLSRHLKTVLRNLPGGERLVELSLYAIVAGHIIQLVLFYTGVPGYTELSFGSAETGRVFVFQGASVFIVLVYAILQRKWVLTVFCEMIAAATASKSYVVASVIIILGSLLWVNKKYLIRTVVGLLIALGMFVALTSAGTTRLYEYWSNGREDSTRSYEVSYAEHSFLQSSASILLGIGVATDITPGVETTDPRWFENSKVDIEQLYWALLAKIGMLGTGLLVFLFMKQKKGPAWFALIVTELIIGLGSSGLVFASSDGPHIILMTLCVTVLLHLRAEQDANQASARQPT